MEDDASIDSEFTSASDGSLGSASSGARIVSDEFIEDRDEVGPDSWFDRITSRKRTERSSGDTGRTARRGRASTRTPKSRPLEETEEVRSPARSITASVRRFIRGIGTLASPQLGEHWKFSQDETELLAWPIEGLLKELPSEPVNNRKLNIFMALGFGTVLFGTRIFTTFQLVQLQKLRLQQQQIMYQPRQQAPRPQGQQTTGPVNGTQPNPRGSAQFMGRMPTPDEVLVTVGLPETEADVG